MRKFIALFSALMIPVGLLALPVGNPWDASLFCHGVFLKNACGDFCCPNASWCDVLSVRLGFYADYVHDRKMEVDLSVQDSDIRQTKLYTYAGFFALNIWDRLDLYTALGVSHLHLETNLNAFAAGNINTLNLTLETETDFSYVLGAKATLWQCGCFAIGADAKYFYTDPGVKSIAPEAQTPFYPNDLNAKYQEWQLAVGAAYRVNIASTIAAIPYLAIKGGQSRLDFGDFRIFNFPASPLLSNLEFYKLKNQRGVGYVFGISLLGCDKWEITAEWRFVDEIAFDMNTQFRF